MAAAPPADSPPVKTPPGVAAATAARPAQVALAVVFGGLALLAGVDHDRFAALAQEDGPIEWATVVAWLGAAALFARGAFASSSRSSTSSATGGPAALLARCAYAAVAAFCVFCAGEEISWGQRLLAFQPPEAFLELNYQQELNLHNLLLDDRVLGFKLASKVLVALIALGYGVLVPLVARAVRGRRALLDAALVVAPPWFLAPCFALVALVELTYPVELTGEAAELALALTFAAAGAAHAFVARARRAIPIVIALALVFGGGASLAANAILFGSDAAGTAAARAELAALAGDLAAPGIVQAKLHEKRSVHRRLYTATRAGYLKFGKRGAFLQARGTPAERDVVDPRRDRRGYFLDPWHNPYWLYFDRRTGRATLYSFGPNRMRDTAVKRSGEAGGDDLAVTLRLDADDAAEGDDDG